MTHGPAGPTTPPSRQAASPDATVKSTQRLLLNHAPLASCQVRYENQLPTGSELENIRPQGPSANSECGGQGYRYDSGGDIRHPINRAEGSENQEADRSRYRCPTRAGRVTSELCSGEHAYFFCVQVARSRTRDASGNATSALPATWHASGPS
jgi:hypothetical protein